MDTPVTPTAADPLEESFDLLARQEKTEGEVAALRSDLALCLLYTSPSPRDRQKSRMPSSA